MQPRCVSNTNIDLYWIFIHIKGKQSDFLNVIPLENLLGPRKLFTFLSQLHFNGNADITINDVFLATRKTCEVVFCLYIEISFHGILIT